jgi:hypothetical protein
VLDLIVMMAMVVDLAGIIKMMTFNIARSNIGDTTVVCADAETKVGHMKRISGVAHTWFQLMSGKHTVYIVKNIKMNLY